MMKPSPTIDDVLRLAGGLSAIDKLRVIEQLAQQVESAMLGKPESTAGALDTFDEQYHRGYEQTPEDAADVEALLPHLPMKKWE